MLSVRVNLGRGVAGRRWGCTVPAAFAREADASAVHAVVADTVHTRARLTRQTKAPRQARLARQQR